MEYVGSSIMVGNKYYVLIHFPIEIVALRTLVFYLWNIFSNYLWLKKGGKSILYCQFKSRKKKIYIFPSDKEIYSKQVYLIGSYIVTIILPFL